MGDANTELLVLLDETVLEILWLTTELVEVKDCDELLVSVEELESCEEVEDTKDEVVLDETVLEVLRLTTELVEVNGCDELLVSVEELESCEEVEDTKDEVVLLDSDDEVDFVELISVLLLEITGAS